MQFATRSWIDIPIESISEVKRQGACSINGVSTDGTTVIGYYLMASNGCWVYHEVIVDTPLFETMRLIGDEAKRLGIKFSKP